MIQQGFQIPRIVRSFQKGNRGKLHQYNSSVDHQNKHKCQKTIVLDPGLAYYYGLWHGSLLQQEHDPLQYLGRIKEYTAVEHSFLFRPSLIPCRVLVAGEEPDEDLAKGGATRPLVAAMKERPRARGGGGVERRKKKGKDG